MRRRPLQAGMRDTSTEKRVLSELLDAREPQSVHRLARELHRRYSRLVYYFLRVFGIPEDSQPDLFNQIFLKIIRGLPRIKHRNNYKGWVTRIAKNEIISFSKRRARDERRLRGFDSEAAITSIARGESPALFPAEMEIYDRQLHEAFECCVSGLNEKIRRPFLMHYREFKKWREIAAELGIYIDTARKQGQRAKEQVIRCLRHKLNKGFKVIKFKRP